MSPIIRAIDVGHKNVKTVIETGDEIVCRVFPACAPVAAGRDLSDAFGRKRQTMLVDVDGLSYEVGPDALLAEKAAPAHNPGCRQHMTLWPPKTCCHFRKRVTI